MSRGSNTRLKLLCSAMLVAGLVAAIMHGFMSLRFAQRMTVDDEGWWTQGGAVVTLSILGWLSALCSGLLAERRRFWSWVGAALLMAAAVGFTGYTVSNSTGYAGFQVYSKTRPAEQRRKTAEDVASIQNQIAVEERKELRTAFFRTYLTAKSSADKEKALGQIEGMTQKPVTLAIPDAPEIAVVDPRAEVAKNLFGMSMEKAQALSIAALPILLVVGEIMGPFLAAFLWPHAAPESTQRLPATLRQLSFAEARSDVLAAVAKGEEICTTEFGQRWRVDKGQASKWLDEVQRRGEIKRARRGRRIVAVAPARANGHMKLMS